MKLSSETLILFDDECLSCNAFVRFVLQNDPSRQTKFAPLNGKTSIKQLSCTVPTDSIVVIAGNVVLKKSDAIFKILSFLKYPWRLLTIFAITPIFLRDWFYDLFSKHRHLLGQRKTVCLTLTPEEKLRFLP